MNDERIINYLLEELTEEESERFEDECFAQESWPARLEQVEEDLIEDYLRGALTPERRRRFEQNYLTTDARLERVRFTAAILRHVDERVAATESPDAKGGEETDPTPKPDPDKTPPGWFRSFWAGRTWAPRAAFALVLALVVLGAWWAYRSGPTAPRHVAVVALSISNAERGEAEGDPPKRVKLSPGDAALRISLTLPAGLPPAARYRVELEGGAGDKKSFEAAGQDGGPVTVEIPASQLAPGQYALKLFALREGGTEQRVRGNYLFIVE